MIEANRAYASGDEERLRRILEAWERSPESVQGDDPEAVRSRLLRQIAEVEDELSAYAGELADLQDTALWKLKAMVDEAGMSRVYGGIHFRFDIDAGRDIGRAAGALALKGSLK